MPRMPLLFPEQQRASHPPPHPCSSWHLFFIYLFAIVFLLVWFPYSDLPCSGLSLDGRCRVTGICLRQNSLDRHRTRKGLINPHHILANHRSIFLSLYSRNSHSRLSSDRAFRFQMKDIYRIRDISIFTLILILEPRRLIQ